MRKILSIVLALSMALSLISGAAFASEGETEVVAEDPTYYSFDRGKIAELNGAMSGKTNKMNSQDCRLDGILWWDYDDEETTGAASHWRASNMKDFANHGWKWLDINNEALTYNETSGLNAISSTLIQLNTYQRLLSAYNGTPLTADELQVAFTLKKPETTGFYVPSINANKEGTAATFTFYMSSELPENELTKEDVIKNYVKDERIAHSVKVDATNATDYKFDNLVYSDSTSEKELVFVASQQNSKVTSGHQGMRMYSITLTPVTVKSIALSTNAIAFDAKNETAQLSVSATLDDETKMGVVDSFVTYDSSDDKVATVDTAGKVTAVGWGEATITASVGGKTAEATVVVDGTKVYEFNRSLVYNVDGVWENKEGTANPAWVAMGVVDYGTHGWKYFAIDKTSLSYVMGTNDNGVHSIYPMNLNTELRVHTQHSGYDGHNLENGVQIAMALKSPGTDFYAATVNANHTAGNVSRSFDFYLSNENASKDVKDYIESADFAYTATRRTNTEVDVPVVIYAEETKNLIAGFNVPATCAYINIEGVTLTPVSVEKIELSATKTSLDIGEETAFTIKAGDYDVVDSFVTYTVEETGDVIDVAPDGTVTAKGAGTATITATVGGLTDTVGITVSEAYSAPAEIYYGEYNNVDNTADVKKAVPGTELTFTAEDKEGYTFRYWVLGSAATGRYYSSEKTVEVKPYANIALTAIYTPVEENPAAIVELFNWNGAFIEALKASEIKTALGAIQPEMVGYGFANQWKISDEMYLTADSIITEDTRAMAVFNKVGTYEEEVSPSGTSQNGWTRNGELVTYDANYTFLTWLNPVGTIAENTEAVTDKIPLVVLEKNDSTGAYMLEYDKGEYEIVEAGILFGSTEKPIVSSAYSKAKVKNIKPHGQFTVKPEGTTENMEAFARGYVMYKDKNDSNKIKVIYSK